MIPDIIPLTAEGLRLLSNSGIIVVYYAAFARCGGAMKKSVFIMFCLLILFLPLTVKAEPVLYSLTINEELVSGPNDVYLTVTGTYSDGSSRAVTEGLTWTSSDPEIATVSFSGRVHFTGKGGTVTITAWKMGVTGKKTVTVKPWPESLEIENILSYSPNPYRLLAKGKFSDGQTRYFGPEDNVQWVSLNPWVAWVNSQGVVTFTGEPGYVSIKAVWGSLSDSVNTTVAENGEDSGAFIVGIRIKEDLNYSASPVKITLVAVRTDGSEETLDNEGADWSSSNTAIAKVDSQGILTFTGNPGFTTIKVSYGGYHYEKLVTVGRFVSKIFINQSLNYTATWEGVPLQLSVTAHYNDGSEFILTSGVAWSIDNKKAAALTEGGILTFTGESGKAVIKASVAGEGDAVIEDTLSLEVPVYDKPVAQRIFIDENPVSAQGILAPKAYCLYSDGTIRDVSELAFWSSANPGTASIYQGKVYLSPNPGRIEITATYKGFSDTVTGYVHRLTSNNQNVQQIRIKENTVPYSPKPVNLTAYALLGNGIVKNVTSGVRWSSSDPLVAKVNKGVLTFTGRIGRAKISAVGYGFRDEIEISVTPAELEPRVEELVIEGALDKGANQLRLLARYNDGTVRDVTAEAVWNTSNKNAAVVTEGIVMFPKGFKPVTVMAAYKGKEAVLQRI